MRRPPAPDPNTVFPGSNQGRVEIEPPLLQGRWRLVRTLEATVAGVAFLAWDAAQRAWVTVEVARDELGVRRLKRERAILRELDHPGVDKVQILAQEGAIVFAVRRYLHDRASELAPMSPAHALRLVLEAADALTHAHERHQVHGALRSARLRFDATGRVVVTGWADRLEIPSEADHLAHLAPEVRAGLPPTEAADLYGLGATLYSLVLGYARPDLHQHSSQEGLSPGLRRVIASVCARDPASRPRSALELHEWLVNRMGSAETAAKEPWGPVALPPGPPPTVFGDAPLVGLARMLNERAPQEITSDLRTPTSETSMTGSVDPALRRGESGTPLPYTMPKLVRKDPGFRDPFELVDPADLPAYVDRSYQSREPPRPRSWGPVEPAGPQAKAAASSPIGLFKVMAVVLGLGGGVLVGLPLATWLTSEPREVVAGRELVDAVRAEADVMAPLARTAADPGPLERAWFTFTDAPSADHAVEVVRQASAMDHESLDPAHHEAIVRLREALDRFDRSR